MAITSRNIDPLSEPEHPSLTSSTALSTRKRSLASRSASGEEESEASDRPCSPPPPRPMPKGILRKKGVAFVIKAPAKRLRFETVYSPKAAGSKGKVKNSGISDEDVDEQPSEGDTPARTVKRRKRSKQSEAFAMRSELGKAERTIRDGEEEAQKQRRTQEENKALMEAEAKLEKNRKKARGK